MIKAWVWWAALSVCLAGCALAPRTADRIQRTESLRGAEMAFAQSMAERDFQAFAAHIAEDAVFINGGQPLHGKAAILAHWKQFFDAPAAPFSWTPDLAVVTTSGDLGYTHGPVHDPQGQLILRFYSTWRWHPEGQWQVVFDNGYVPAPQAQ